MINVVFTTKKKRSLDYKPVQSFMAATGVYTVWRDYQEWNHVTDLKIRINIKSVYILRFSANGFIDLNSPLSHVCGTLLPLFNLIQQTYKRLNDCSNIVYPPAHKLINIINMDY